MLRRSNPKRHLTRPIRVDVPFLRVRVVVRVNLRRRPVDPVRAVLDVEHRAYLGRERPTEALPRAGKAEASRRDLHEPDGAANGPLTVESGYGMLLAPNPYAVLEERDAELIESHLKPAGLAGDRNLHSVCPLVKCIAVHGGRLCAGYGMLCSDPYAVADVAAAANCRWAEKINPAMGSNLDLSRVVGS